MALVLGVAAALRLGNIAHNTYVIFPDETFQYLEPAHRLAFGSGIVTWEYIEGIRSWLLPAALALLMRATSLLTASPRAYIALIRTLLATLSLVVPLLAYDLARSAGRASAIAAGLLCAGWYELIYYSPVVLTEVLATHLTLLAVWLDRRAPARHRTVGALLGLAACLRYQYAPAVAVLLLLRFRRGAAGAVLAAATAATVVATTLGGLDWATWGAPFQSVWLNFSRNAVDGISGAMGTEPWYYPFAYFLAAWGPLAPLLLAFAAYGARAAPELALAALVTLISHALTPHKEVRFVYLAIAIVTVLIGLGLAHWIGRMGRMASVAASISILLLAGGEAAFASSHAFPPDAWDRDRLALRAFASARSRPELCGLAVRSLYIVRNGGYTYLHRAVPIYFELAEMRLPGVAAPLPLRIELDGAAVPQFVGSELANHTDRFNVLVGLEQDGLPGFEKQGCVGYSPWLGSRICLFERPGPCTPP